jgi:sarcosine oxidase subunit gamma
VSGWRRIGAWNGIAVDGHLGAGISGEAGVTITPRHDLALAYIIASANDQVATADLVSRQFGIELPLKPKAISRGELTIIWSGPSQWLAVSEKTGLAHRLADALGGRAAITDQSDARAILLLEGARVREIFAKGCPVDLHQRSFSHGDAAVTAIAGIGVQLWQVEDGESFHVAVARSTAGSFWSWLTQSAAEFGVEVRAPVVA